MRTQSLTLCCSLTLTLAPAALGQDATFDATVAPPNAEAAVSSTPTASTPAVDASATTTPAVDASTTTTPAVDASATTSEPATTETVTLSPASPRPVTRPPYLQRHRPRANLFEVGFFGGVFFPNEDHGLHDEATPHQPYRTAGELGLRFAYFPLSFFGIEFEAAALPTSTEDERSAGLWTARGHGILQLPTASVTPFLLIGGGSMGSSSDALGTDVDPAAHFGLGVKAALDDFLSLRLDLRDVRLPKNATEGRAQVDNAELLLGLTFTLDRHRKPKVETDTDGDGTPDAADACPTVAGTGPDGCPLDQDGDGIPDAEDRCPTQAGSSADGGCPPPPVACPECPPCAEPNLDPDGDGIRGDADKCPHEPETRNGYQDDDGCPDEIPEAAKKFNGTMSGITFQFGSAIIQAASYPVLDDAAKTLAEFPELRVRITGHTDNIGARERNLQLSEARAKAVKDYLVRKGISEARLESAGLGPDQPKADNATPAGQQTNRRIEFSILK